MANRTLHAISESGHQAFCVFFREAQPLLPGRCPLSAGIETTIREANKSAPTLSSGSSWSCPYLSIDISQITPKFRGIVPPFHRQENCTPSAAPRLRWQQRPAGQGGILARAPQFYPGLVLAKLSMPSLAVRTTPASLSVFYYLGPGLLGFISNPMIRRSAHRSGIAARTREIHAPLLR